MSAAIAKKGFKDYVGFRCEPSIRDELNEVSAAEERSIAYLVRVFVAEGLRAYKEEPRPVRLGLGNRIQPVQRVGDEPKLLKMLDWAYSRN